METKGQTRRHNILTFYFSSMYTKAVHVVITILILLVLYYTRWEFYILVD
jgi:hypothetical protein